MTTTTSSTLRLAAAGQPLAQIISPARPSAAEEYAAEELHRHLYALAGAGPQRQRRFTPTSPRIFLNAPDAARGAGIDIDALDLGEEDFHLESRHGHIHILAGSPRALIYGVYELLHTLGCRWFTPTTQHIPHWRTVELPPVARTHRPVFEYRDHLCWEISDPAWCVRNRLNGHSTPIPDYMGGSIRYGLFVHTFEHLLPPAEFFAEHPEYFSLVNGARRRDQSQLCLTHPDVLRIVTDRVLATMRENPSARIFSVSQNDWDNYCQCPACTAVAREEGSQAGPLLRFVNALAEHTARIYPDKLIDTLAYTYTLPAPTHVTPGPNVRVRLCAIRCCQGHGLGACDEPHSRQFLQAITAWSRLSRQLYIWHYCTNFAHYLAPMPNFDELQASIRLYRDARVQGLFMQGASDIGGGAESAELRAYLVARLLWNPDLPVWSLVDEFLPAYYGAAAPNVRRYLDIFHERVRADRTLHPSLYDPPTHRLFADAVLREATDALRTGESLVRGPAQRRIRMLRNGLTYTRLAKPPGRFRREDNIYRSDATAQDLADCDAVLRDCRAAGIQELHEATGREFAFARLRNRLIPQPVRWLDDGTHRIAVVPGLGGRLIEWHAFDRQWLSQPQLGGPWWQTYPLQEGYQESAYFSAFQHVGWTEAHGCRQHGNSLRLTCRLDHDITMGRTFRLDAGRLHITTRLTNNSDTLRPVGWGTASRWLLPAPAAIAFHAGPLDRAMSWDDLPEGYDHPLQIEWESLPEAQIIATAGQFRLTVILQGRAIRRIKLARLAAAGALIFDARTDLASLAPGETIDMAQQIALESTA